MEEKTPPATDDVRLIEALEARRALETIIRTMGDSPGDLRAIFDVILEYALRLCRAKFGIVLTHENGLFEAVGLRGVPEPMMEWFLNARSFEAFPGGALDRVAKNREVLHIDDVSQEAVYKEKKDRLRVLTVEEAKARTFLAVPLLVQGRLVGAFVVYRQEVAKFSNSEVALAQVFARNAAIAIEHTNLIKEVQVQKAELEALNTDLRKRVSKQVGELERLGKLKRFLSPDVAELIVSSGDDSLLKSHRRRVAAVFCDLRGFTAFSEFVEPEEAIDVLQNYHRDMGRLIAKYAGTIDHRAGDGIMVIFNDPIRCEKPALQAIKMATDMRAHMKRLIEQWSRLDYDLGFGVGISFGYATLGLVGDDNRSDYTANGTVINLAARLCDAAQTEQILITQRTLSEVEAHVEVRALGTHDFKGISRPQKVFNVVALA